ncbi:hypothetical protein SAMN04488494_1188 [Xylanibacter ruminicola]|uniref:O-antigen ligase-related domain-containing protein n=1 Tax=Xylanibacter ruminicola TaxID=839 RepID=A0A1M7FK67_XYLRU|nr:O-antigen ligase family protein [Xylanibacter ruminicola]SHM04492.1 hypothetical protein SAMN04488494_1188 [Xylanibacter ruminicola]
MNKFTSLFRNPCVWYLLLWSLYYLQGTLYEEGSFISRSSLLIIFVVSLNHAYQVMRMSNKPMYFKGLNTLFFMYTLYGLVIFITDGTITHGRVMTVQSFLYLKSYYLALLPVYSCYYYARKGLLDQRVLSIFAVMFVFIGIAEYYRMQNAELEKLAALNSSRTEITNNMGYEMLAILPSLLILNKRQYIQYTCIGICLAFIMMGMKRGAILCAALFVMSFVWHKMNYSRGNRRLVVIIAIVIGFTVLYYYVERMMATSDYFMYRIEQTRSGDASGRESMYMDYFKYYVFDAGIIAKIIGHGANGTIKVFYNYAHNDWLEILTNQGLLGILVLCNYISCFWKTIRRRKLHPESKFALQIIFLFFFLQTFFSAGITNTTIFTACMFGYALNDGFAKELQPKRLK